MVAALAIPEKKSINPWRHETGFDDAWVTTGDGNVNVDGIMVRGSVRFQRDPRLHRLADERYKPTRNRGASRAEAIHNYRDEKWCMVCGDVRPMSYFSPHPDTWDKLDPRCKQCENERKRKAYAQKTGHEPRSYVRQQKAS